MCTHYDTFIGCAWPVTTYKNISNCHVDEDGYASKGDKFLAMKIIDVKYKTINSLMKKGQDDCHDYTNT